MHLYEGSDVDKSARHDAFVVWWQHRTLRAIAERPHAAMHIA
jgi:hypothetical protein